MLLENLPEIAYRDNLQLATLTATVLNMMGGKPDPNDEDVTLVPVERMYSPEELLVYFAQKRDESGWTRASAVEVLRVRADLPAWVRDGLPWDEIESLTVEVNRG